MKQAGKCPECGARMPLGTGRYVCPYCQKEIDRGEPEPKKQVIVVVPPREDPTPSPPSRSFSFT